MSRHWKHGITASLVAALVLLLAPPASAQSRDEFSYWDLSGNGDLTCDEAKDGLAGDDGLKLPAYQDNRDGTGIIYEWLERSRSSDGNNDGVACESISNPGGYIPNVQPVEPQGCPADAETWRGLQVCEEQPRDGYDRDTFGTGYSSLEDEIIDMLPPTMKAGGQVYTPYSCLAFDIRADGTAETDIEHIVALAEAHDSIIADDRRRNIASDIDNLTIADLTVNRSQKGDRDAGEWMPARHGAWFAAQVIAVKLEYGLSVDPAERDALERLLAGGGAELNCVAADTTSPTVAISSNASAPVTGPFSIAIAFSEPVTGFELADLVVGNGSASELQGNNASYTATITPEASGTVTVDIAAGAAQDGAGNPSAAADQFSITADTAAPTVTTTSAASEPVSGPFSITVTFSEPVTGFELADLVVGNGSTSELQGSEASYTATVTPTASGAVTVDIAAGAAEDSAGNPSAAADQFSITADLTPEDTTAPTVTTTSAASEPVSGPFSITVTFSEPVTGFELADLVVGNGSTSELQGSEASYTATVTPTASGAVTVDIAAGAAEDSAGNPSAAADQFSITADLTPVPVLPLAGAVALAALLLIGGIRRRRGVLTTT